MNVKFKTLCGAAMAAVMMAGVSVSPLMVAQAQAQVGLPNEDGEVLSVEEEQQAAELEQAIIEAVDALPPTATEQDIQNTIAAVVSSSTLSSKVKRRALRRVASNPNVNPVVALGATSVITILPPPIIVPAPPGGDGAPPPPPPPPPTGGGAGGGGAGGGGGGGGDY